MALCKRCGKGTATVSVTVESYQMTAGVIAKDELDKNIVIETKADICKGCETFYKEYTDPKGKKIDEIGSNFNITYQNII